MKKQDLILAGILLILALAAGIGYSVTHGSPAARAEISVDGTVVETLDLSVDQELTVDGVNGGTNHLIVRDGSVWCDEASCPDGLCIDQGKQNRDGSVIVCLPNRMIVKILGGS